MANAVTNLWRLARAGIVLAQHGVRFVPKGTKVPLLLHIAYAATLPVRIISWPFRRKQPKETRVAAALTRLGPSYVKLGQFLGTRGDLIGPELAADLRQLQDRLPPFSQAEARAAIEEALGGKVEDHFIEFGPAVAAASIAQVHKAKVRITVDGVDTTRDVAVKILRPQVEKRFKRDLDSYFFAARVIERLHAPIRRLKPTAIVENLARTTQLEMDLRLEAAAISEMADNIKADIAQGAGLEGGSIRVPAVDWRRTQRRVLTIEWIDGTPIADRARLTAQGFDLKALGVVVLRSFLRHAMRDGFFHGDMHQGNLLVDAKGQVVAVDFGIVGRLGPRERKFLAEILFGLITRDYRRAAQIHFDAGYVPAHHSVEVFAQAMRAIGEPIHGRTADEISMADLLGQLFAYTEVFDMVTRPELILLQKSMVIVEGVARSLDPTLNLWTAAEPIAKEWIEANYGVAGRLRDVGDGAGAVGRLLAEVPRLLEQAERTALSFADGVERGIRLDDDTVTRLAAANARAARGGGWLAGLAAAALAVVAGWLLWTF
jgi:ubiquinone biosynthesis protein